MNGIRGHNLIIQTLHLDFFVPNKTKEVHCTQVETILIINVDSVTWFPINTISHYFISIISLARKMQSFMDFEPLNLQDKPDIVFQRK